MIEPLLPEELPKLKGDRPRIDDRAAPTGIIFVLKSVIPWEMLPQGLSCESDITCWRCLKEWEEDGVWEQLHQTVYASLASARAPTARERSATAPESASARARRLGHRSRHPAQHLQALRRAASSLINILDGRVGGLPALPSSMA